MKKLLVTILAIVYLTVSSGATVNLHYCMGKLMSWDMSAWSKSKCGSCGMEKSGHKGCCHDEQKLLKVEKDQKTNDTGYQISPLSWSAIAQHYFELPIVGTANRFNNYPLTHSPPKQGSIPIFIRNCNFRI